MSKIVKNVTGSSIDISDVGVTILALSSYLIPPSDYLLWAGSDDTVTFVGSADLVINDGSFDLSISDGIDLVKGLYPREVNPVSSFGLYDEIQVTYPSTITEVHTYKLSSSDIGTVTVTYTNASKADLLSVVYNAL
jgi:hypothetical protein